jgi:hypothetical protein
MIRFQPDHFRGHQLWDICKKTGHPQEPSYVHNRRATKSSGGLERGCGTLYYEAELSRTQKSNPVFTLTFGGKQSNIVGFQ